MISKIYTTAALLVIALLFISEVRSGFDDFGRDFSFRRDSIRVRERDFGFRKRDFGFRDHGFGFNRGFGLGRGFNSFGPSRFGAGFALGALAASSSFGLGLGGVGVLPAAPLIAAAPAVVAPAVVAPAVIAPAVIAPATSFIVG